MSSCLMSLLLPAGTVFGQELSLDFGNVFEDNSTRSGSEHLRFALSHQLTGHINRHRMDAEARRARGLEVNRTTLDIHYQNPFASGWLLQGSAQLQAWLPGDYAYHQQSPQHSAGRDRHEWRLDELFVQRSGPRYSLALGRQTLVWGETTGNSVLDVINISEYRDLDIIDIEEARRNQWLLKWNAFGERSQWSGFVNLHPEFNPVALIGSPLYPTPPQIAGEPLRLPYYQRSHGLFEAGVRWQRSFRGSDMALMAARLYENALQYALPALPTEAGWRAEPQINDYTLLGLSFNRALGRLVLVLDAAWSQGVIGRGHSTLEPEFKPRDRLGLSGGLEYALTTNQQLSLSVSASMVHRDTDVARQERGKPVGMLLMRYSNSLLNADLLLSSTLQLQFDEVANNNSQLLHLAADYRVSDDWLLGSQLVFTHGNTDHPMYHLRGDVRLGLSLRHDF